LNAFFKVKWYVFRHDIIECISTSRYFYKKSVNIDCECIFAANVTPSKDTINCIMLLSIKLNVF